MLSPVTQEARVQFPASAIIQTNFFFLLLLQFWPLKMILTTRVYQLESNPLGCTLTDTYLLTCSETPLEWGKMLYSFEKFGNWLRCSRNLFSWYSFVEKKRIKIYPNFIAKEIKSQVVFSWSLELNFEFEFSRHFSIQDSTSKTTLVFLCLHNRTTCILKVCLIVYAEMPQWTKINNRLRKLTPFWPSAWKKYWTYFNKGAK